MKAAQTYWKWLAAVLLPKHRLALIIGVGLVVGFYLILASRSLLHQPLTFDEGWDLQAARNLALHGVYASQGTMWGGVNKIFDPYVSTGPSVLFPIALVFKLFGVGVIQARLVIMAFYVAVMVLVAWYVYMHTKSLLAIIAAASILLILALPITFRLDVLGEFPAIAFALASFIAWEKRRYGLAGMFGGLTVLAKAIMLFLPLAGSLILFIQVCRHWRQIRTALPPFIRWCIGVAIPLGGIEIFKYLQLGGLHAYVHNWREYIQFFKTTGSGLGTNGTAPSIHQKYDLLGSTIQLGLVFMILLTVAVVVALYIRRKNLLSSLTAQAYIWLSVVFYLLWWFLIANGGFARYVVPVSGMLIAATFATAFGKPVFHRRTTLWRSMHALAALTVAIVVLLGIYQQHFSFSPNYQRLSLQDQQQVARRVAASKPTALSHAGFWQNPEIMFMGGLHSQEQGLRGDSSFQLLLSPTMKELVPADYAKARQECYKIYFQQAGYTYCLAMKNS